MRTGVELFDSESSSGRSSSARLQPALHPSQFQVTVHVAHINFEDVAGDPVEQKETGSSRGQQPDGEQGRRVVGREWQERRRRRRGRAGDEGEHETCSIRKECAQREKQGHNRLREHKTQHTARVSQ